ncbi:MAG: hypothetical protein ACTHK7_18060, partial [Aureliella sp.]
DTGIASATPRNALASKRVSEGRTCHSGLPNLVSFGDRSIAGRANETDPLQNEPGQFLPLRRVRPSLTRFEASAFLGVALAMPVSSASKFQAPEGL